jgi:integrase
VGASLGPTAETTKPAKATIDEVWAMYLAQHPGVWNTKRNLSAAWTNHIEPMFAGRQVRAIHEDDVRRYREKLEAGGMGPESVQNQLNYLAAMFNWAMRSRPRYVDANPVPSGGYQIVTKALTALLAEGEVHELRMALRPSLRLAVDLGTGLGLRYGEAAGLTDDRIDRVRRTATIDRQIQGSGDGLHFCPPKNARRTNSAIRDVPISVDLMGAIDAHIDQHGLGEHGLLLHSDGAMLSSNIFVPHFRRARSKVFPGARTWPRFHAFRDFYVSLLAKENIDMATVRELIGHAPNSPVTEARYRRLWPGTDDRVRAAVDGVRLAKPALRRVK